jgi:hypothetical protein
MPALTMADKAQALIEQNKETEYSIEKSIMLRINDYVDIPLNIYEKPPKYLEGKSLANYIKIADTDLSKLKEALIGAVIEVNKVMGISSHDVIADASSDDVRDIDMLQLWSPEKMPIKTPTSIGIAAERAAQAEQLKQLNQDNNFTAYKTITFTVAGSITLQLFIMDKVPQQVNPRRYAKLQQADPKKLQDTIKIEIVGVNQSKVGDEFLTASADAFLG